MAEKVPYPRIKSAIGIGTLAEAIEQKLKNIKQKLPEDQLVQALWAEIEKIIKEKN